MEILFPHDKFLHEKKLSRYPLPQTPPPEKNLKTLVYFPITNTICKQWAKFITCSPSLRDSGGLSRPQRHSYHIFTTMLNKIAISKLKNERMRGPSCSKNFGQLKRALELLISVKMSPLVTF